MASRPQKDLQTYHTHPTSPRFRPHALALGQLALAWNGLHETMALLFCSVMGGGTANQFLGVWHALKTDRSQRDILLAAAKNVYRGMIPPTYLEDIEWLCGKADSLEDARNDALHSPLVAHRRTSGEILVQPIIGLGHVRAKKLSEKNLLKEFRWCRDRAVSLAGFAHAMAVAFSSLSDTTHPWPERPPWPKVGRPNETKPHPPTRKAKHPRPPRSSRA
jgi:hypothetical protein